MGREIRRVPKDWEHPKRDGKYVPMVAHFPYNEEEVREGLKDGWLKGDPPHYGVDIMPDWPEEERTHYQMYESCTEGTPISPVLESPEAVARWLVDNKASWFAGDEASYDAWLRCAKGGHGGDMLLQVKVSSNEAQ
jgi:hypothetical protein